MKILITGAAGRVGRATHMRLCTEHEVIGLDSTASPTTDIVASVQDAARLRAALRGVQAVVHVAALHAPHVGRVDDALFEAVNVQATEALARLAAQAGVQRFVFTSTTALYGATASAQGGAAWVDEHTLPQPRSIYHRSKLAAEARLQAVAAETGLAVTVLRMSRCFAEPAPLMAVYRLHRGIDLRDVADAHALAATQALTCGEATGQEASTQQATTHDTTHGTTHGATLGATHGTTQGATTPEDVLFQRYVVSGRTPFLPQDAEALASNAPDVIEARCPALAAEFRRRGWPLPATIDRVYVPDRAMAALHWQPRHGFDEVLAQLDRRSLEVLPPRWPQPIM